MGILRACRGRVSRRVTIESVGMESLTYRARTLELSIVAKSETKETKRTSPPVCRTQACAALRRSAKCDARRPRTSSRPRPFSASNHRPRFRILRKVFETGIRDGVEARTIESVLESRVTVASRLSLFKVQIGLATYRSYEEIAKRKSRHCALGG